MAEVTSFDLHRILSLLRRAKAAAAHEQPPTLARGRITIEGVRLRFNLRANAPGRQPIANVWPDVGHDWPAVSEDDILGAIARAWQHRQQGANAQSA